MTPCILATGYLTPNGYGRVTVQGTRQYAHRVAYERAKGPIPKGLHIDHLCRVKSCVNPDHLEAVTPRENTLRGVSPGAVAFRENRCAHGHPLNEENTYIRPDGRRRCRTCDVRRSREYQARKAAA